MFVKTEDHGIINLSCFPQVDVVKHGDTWRLQAFSQKPPNAPTNFLSGFPLAEFKEEVEARYGFCRLYSALEAGVSVWDPHTVGWFSDLWGKAKKELSSPNKAISKPHVHLEILEPLELKITGLREITIVYPVINRRGGVSPIVTSEEVKGNIENKIQSTLKAADPMQNSLTEWKIDWEDLEDKIPTAL